MRIHSPELRGLRSDIEHIISELRKLPETDANEDILIDLVTIEKQLPASPPMTTPHVKVNIKKMRKLQKSWFKAYMKIYKALITSEKAHEVSVFENLINLASERTVWMQTTMVRTIQRKMSIRDPEVKELMDEYLTPPSKDKGAPPVKTPPKVKTPPVQKPTVDKPTGKK